MKKLLLILSFVLLPLLSSQAEEAKQSPLFTETDKGYSITFPSQWQWQRDFMGLDVFASAPSKDVQSTFLANISVISGQIGKDVSVDAFFNENMENLKKALREVKVVETGKIFIDGLEGRKVVYNHSMADIHLRVAQYFVVKNGIGYIVTGTALEEGFPKFVDTFEAAVRSFKLLQPAATT
jgi:hypothetical protein